jgi:hypothetical protein
MLLDVDWSGSDVSVGIWVGGNDVARMPADGAREALLELAQVFLTAAHRLDVVEAAEESTTSDKVSYRIDFGPELLPMTPKTLLSRAGVARMRDQRPDPRRAG